MKFFCHSGIKIIQFYLRVRLNWYNNKIHIGLLRKRSWKLNLLFHRILLFYYLYIFLSEGQVHILLKPRIVRSSYRWVKLSKCWSPWLWKPSGNVFNENDTLILGIYASAVKTHTAADKRCYAIYDCLAKLPLRVCYSYCPNTTRLKNTVGDFAMESISVALSWPMHWSPVTRVTRDREIQNFVGDIGCVFYFY